MNKIKTYNSFINESSSHFQLGFTNSKEYYDLLSTYDNEGNKFKEYFYELSDDTNCEILIRSSLEDSNGEAIWIKPIDFSKIYKIFFRLTITAKNILSLESGDLKNLSKISNNIDKILKSCEFFEKNILAEGYLIRSKKVDQSTSKIYITFDIEGKSRSLNNSIKEYYNKWKNNRSSTYEKGIDGLIEMYKKNGIEDPDLDTNEMDDIVHIGYFTEDEIIVVANFNKITKEFIIDKKGFDESVSRHEFEIGDD